jgi:hypothetical protein
MPLYVALSMPALYFLGAVSSLIAAVWWYRASQVEAPGELRGDVGYGGPAIVDTRPLVEYARESGRRNKIAALWSAAAALFTGLTWFVPWIIGWIAHG